MSLGLFHGERVLQVLATAKILIWFLLFQALLIVGTPYTYRHIPQFLTLGSGIRV